MKTDWMKIVISVAGGVLAGLGLYAGYLTINWAQFFGG